MRDYGAEGQIGLEDSVQEYIEKLLIVFNEVKRVLKPDGTIKRFMGERYNAVTIYKLSEQKFYDWEK